MQVAELLRPLVQLVLLLVDALSQPFYRLLMLKRGSVERFEPLILLFSFLLILQDLLLVRSDVSQDFSLTFKELFLLVIELLGLCNDVFFLLSETLVDFSLFALLLQ